MQNKCSSFSKYLDTLTKSFNVKYSHEIWAKEPINLECVFIVFMCVNVCLLCLLAKLLVWIVTLAYRTLALNSQSSNNTTKADADLWSYCRR